MDTTVDMYLRDVRRVACEPMSRCEEVEAFRRLKDGPDHDGARRRIAEANLRFVVSIAKRYEGCAMPMCDLIGWGNEGLMIAIDKFDVNRGFKFITFAVWWIRQCILKGLHENRRAFRPSMSTVNDMGRLQRARDAALMDDDRESTILELVERSGISQCRIEQAVKLAQSDVSLDYVSSDDGRPLRDFLGVDCEPDLDESVPAKALENLDRRSAMILRSYYGLGGERPISLDKIGEHLGLTRERIRQIRDVALAKLRDNPALRELVV